MKKICAIILAVIMIMICLTASAELNPWTQMKNFKVKTIDGSTFDLYKTLEEKELVLLDLWYIDCIFCPPASASIQTVYEKYKDRVGFLCVNPFDNQNNIKQFEEARGFTVPCAKFGGGAKWTNGYPTFIMIDKEGTVLCNIIGTDDPYEVEAMLEWGLSLTPEEKEEWIARNTSWGAFSGKKYREAADPIEIKQREAFIKAADHAYNLKKDMSLEVTGESVSRIVIDTNHDILQNIEMTGEFYIIPSHTPFTVTVKTGKGFKPAKAYMTVATFNSVGAFAYNNSWSGFCKDIPFKEAKKEKSNYIFDLETPSDDAYFYFLESGYPGGTTYDSMVGLHTFPSEKSAENYLKKCSETFGYEFQWHVE